MTRRPKPSGALRDPPSQHRIYPATFDYLAQPSRRIQGTIRDGLTGNPVPDVTIHGYSFSRSTSDAAGRFELQGYPKSREYSLEILPPSGAPFLAMNLPLDDTPGLEPITADVKLVRGIPVQGRVLDAATGQPVKGSVEYHPLFPNPFIDHHFSRSQVPHSRTRELRADGSFTLTVLPGPGVVLFQAYGGPYESYAPTVGGRALSSSISTYTYDYFQSYLPATVDRNELKKLVKDAPFVKQSDFLQLAVGGGTISPLLLRNYNVAALIDPAADAKGLKLDLSPRRGRSIGGDGLIATDGFASMGSCLASPTTCGTPKPSRSRMRGFKWNRARSKIWAMPRSNSTGQEATRECLGRLQAEQRGPLGPAPRGPFAPQGRIRCRLGRLAGPMVRPGLVGPTPNLLDLNDGDLKWSIDFRRVYSTVLEHWLGLSCQVALGGTFPPLPLFRG